MYSCLFCEIFYINYSIENLWMVVCNKIWNESGFYDLLRSTTQLELLNRHIKIFRKKIDEYVKNVLLKATKTTNLDW